MTTTMLVNMTDTQQFARLLLLVTLFCGCSTSNNVGAPSVAGHGGAATADVAGLKIEAYPTGSDGGSASTVSESGNAPKVTISGLQLVVTRRDDGALEVYIDGESYGKAQEGDHLLIDRDRHVFLNNQPIASKAIDQEP